MIEVNVKFIRKVTKSGDERYYYPFFEIKGHANDGSLNSIKVCASITAMVQVIPEMIVDGGCDYCELSKGYFKFYNTSDLSSKNARNTADKELHYALNTILWQLSYVKKQYPSLFSSFNIEREEI